MLEQPKLDLHAALKDGRIRIVSYVNGIPSKELRELLQEKVK